ncbi:sigma-54-dependent transcriptional regulator [Desulfovibrio ferrophilus]|uniref:Two component, sigma54 specific, transcriptional regulator, Fis family n=1 Tax=Desulfovibrio ferrophilus TaxID=241368 RepID=A0A2Z6AVC4_9BACT|nr:sigma-54 dependent transcriptional regulator [Desulfovibrio ferrophilus]BBD07173.1 two component, sigma54 specific, transcriptional regulator, Fis family [Desulfovibrio ferrophilus]
MKILIVDDEPISLASLGDMISMLRFEPVMCKDAEEALKRCSETYYPVIITDVCMPGIDGLEFLERIKKSKGTSSSDVIIITGHGEMETAVKALRLGAYDFLKKPLDARELAAVVERSAEHQALLFENRDLSQCCDRRILEATLDLQRDLEDAREQLRKITGVGNIVVSSPCMRQILNDARLYHKNTDVPVLIEGETGTGKEIVARLIHHGEDDFKAPFVDINCSAISENLFESELFGYEAGAFTGSDRKGSKGKLEAAGKGSVFLDEIGELPLHIQPKLLRVLEDRTFYRVGGIKKMPLEARIICATNCNLEEMVEEGTFRRDLYHRLKIGYFTILPLRQRKEDIGPLTQLFLADESKAKKKRFKTVSKAALDMLRAYPWKGNVRELKNVIERAVLVYDDDELRTEHLEFLAVKPGANMGWRPSCNLFDLSDLTLPDEPFDLDEFLNDLKRQIVIKAVGRFDNNKTQAAGFLNWDRNKIYRLMDG